MSDYKHWQFSVHDDGIAWLVFNQMDSSVNTLNQETLEEFDRLLDNVAQNSHIKGVIIASGKSTGFIVGADLNAFTKVKDANEAVNLTRKVQQIFDKLEHVHVPTVAMIEGLCLGGGLELALGCQYRVALDDSKTRLGLPEILFGIHPGWGGSVRLPQLIGAMPALDLILTGKMVSAKTAAKLGIVDAVVPLRHIKWAAESFILEKPNHYRPPGYNGLFKLHLVRKAVAVGLRKKLMQKALPQYYPAPYAVINNWVRDNSNDKRAYLNEANSVGKLLVTDTSRNLVRLFFLQERLKSLAKHSTFKATHVHVFGAGTMGGDIAAWCALNGFVVTLQDKESKFVAPAIKRAHQLFSKKLSDKREVQAAMDRLMPDFTAAGLAKADVIIEAVTEDLELKRNLFKAIEAKAKPTAILATNTSSIPIDEMNTAMAQPERLVGLHFFNPVAKMLLVEVVRGVKTSETVFNDAMAFVKDIHRLPLPVKSCPGFLVNRVLLPYLMECIALIDEGYSISDIDAAAREFGMAMGPVEMADAVGLDVCLSVARHMAGHFDGKAPERLEKLVAQGKLGKKTGQGFYNYKDGKPVKLAGVCPLEELPIIANRLVMRLVNEAFAALREGVVTDADLVDVAMVFGAGFAPFRGGPIHYAQSLGKEKLTEMFELLQKDYGDRFKPEETIEQMLV